MGLFNRPSKNAAPSRPSRNDLRGWQLRSEENASRRSALARAVRTLRPALSAPARDNGFNFTVSLPLDAFPHRGATKEDPPARGHLLGTMFAITGCPNGPAEPCSGSRSQKEHDSQDQYSRTSIPHCSLDLLVPWAKTPRGFSCPKAIPAAISLKTQRLCRIQARRSPSRNSSGDDRSNTHRQGSQ